MRKIRLADDSPSDQTSEQLNKKNWRVNCFMLKASSCDRSVISAKTSVFCYTCVMGFYFSSFWSCRFSQFCKTLKQRTIDFTIPGQFSEFFLELGVGGGVHYANLQLFSNLCTWGLFEIMAYFGLEKNMWLVKSSQSLSWWWEPWSEKVPCVFHFLCYLNSFWSFQGVVCFHYIFCIGFSFFLCVFLDLFSVFN